jgi:hypothetical protein
MEKRRLIAALVERTGIRLDEDDPAFVLVELNSLMLENSAGDAAKKIEESAKQFTEAAITQADDFVAVANETLSKFMFRTNEIKIVLDNFQAASLVVAPEAVANQDKTSWAPWLIMTFMIGMAVGVGLSFAI